MDSARRDRTDWLGQAPGWLWLVIAAALSVALYAVVVDRLPAESGGQRASAGRDVVFVIPAGTAAAAMRGEPAFSLPPQIELTTGDTVVIRNDDQAMHYFFDAPVSPGSTLRLTFSRPGRFGYSAGLSCSIDKAVATGVIVDVRPPKTVRAG